MRCAPSIRVLLRSTMQSEATTMEASASTSASSRFSSLRMRCTSTRLLTRAHFPGALAALSLAEAVIEDESEAVMML